uniref:C2H2-type domain-containing protein n=1 Tax=Panagrolaimus superbus TaxID=310955 RepID=A0A914YLY4_9BILA
MKVIADGLLETLTSAVVRFKKAEIEGRDLEFIFFKCPFCDMTFARSDTRNDHELTHTGVKNYKCQFCDMTFTKQQTKQKHELTHTGHQ